MEPLIVVGVIAGIVIVGYAVRSIYIAFWG